MSTTRGDIPAARLVPAEKAGRSRVAQTIQQLRSLREGVELRGLDWRELRDLGRR